MRIGSASVNKPFGRKIQFFLVREGRGRGREKAMAHKLALYIYIYSQLVPMRARRQTILVYDFRGIEGGHPSIKKR